MHKHHLKGCKNIFPVLTPGDSEGLGLGLRLCISLKLPAEAEEHCSAVLVSMCLAHSMYSSAVE